MQEAAAATSECVFCRQGSRRQQAGEREAYEGGLSQQQQTGPPAGGPRSHWEPLPWSFCIACEARLSWEAAKKGASPESMAGGANR